LANLCIDSLDRLGEPIERYVVGRSGLRDSNRRAPKDWNVVLSDLPLAEPPYFGVFGFSGGEMNLPEPYAAAAAICRPNASKTLYVFSDKGDLDAGLGVADTIAKVIEGGVGFMIPFRRERIPEAFAIGLGMPHVPSDLADDLSRTRWFVDRRDGGGAAASRIREVHPCNFIPNAWLSRRIHGQSLEEWINGATWRGSIGRLGGSTWVTWTVRQEVVTIVSEEAREIDLAY